MKLKRLALQGFKSFRDKTLIHFDEGITGIVGPNGCGKSNIVDALFWVMGEMSAKHLRGNSMKDVIFAGSSKYNPGSWAEVSLFLENDESKPIHIGGKVSQPSEIQLTRKLYRNGESEYRINNLPARLKDIQEVFMDTGAGAKSYSIIAQGEIDKLVRAKPEERRVMIEEVAGITKFKLRKKESLKKIEQTELNLGRIKDLETEIYKNLKSLEKQAERAERAKNLKEKIKRNELIVNAHKEFELLKDFHEGQNTFMENKLESENLHMEKDKLEVDLKTERIQKDEIVEDLEMTQKSFNEASRLLAAAEERLKHLNENLENSNEQLSDFDGQEKEILADCEERAKKIEDLKANLEEKQEGRVSEEDILELEKQYESQSLLLKNLEELVENKEKEKSDLRNQFSQADRDYQNFSHQLSDGDKKLEDISSELDELEKSMGDFSHGFAKDAQELKYLKEQYNKNSLQLIELKKLVNEFEAKEKSKLAELQDLEADIIRKESRLGSLKEVQNSIQGPIEGNQKYLSDNEDGEAFVLGLDLTTEDEYSKGVQALLKDILSSLVSPSLNKEALSAWIKEHESSELEVLSDLTTETLGEESVQRLEVYGLEGIRSLSEIVNFKNEGLHKLLAPYLSRFFVAKNFDQEIALQLPKDLQIVGLSNYDGSHVLIKHGQVTQYKKFDLEKEQMGVVERNNLITQITSELEEKNMAIESRRTSLEECRQELLEVKQKYEETREKEIVERGEIATLEAKVASQDSNTSTLTSRREILSKRKTDYSHERFTLIEKRDESLKVSDDFEKNITEIESDLDLKKASLSEEREKFSNIQSQYLESKTLFETWEQSVSGLTGQIEDNCKEVEKLEKKKSELAEKRELSKEKISSLEEEIAQLVDSNQEEATQVSLKEEKLKDKKQELDAVQSQMQEREDRVKKISQAMSKLDKQIIEWEAKLSSKVDDEAKIVRDIFEKYRIDLRETMLDFLEIEEKELEFLEDLSDMMVTVLNDVEMEIEKEPFTFVRRYGQDLRECSDKYRRYKGELNRLGEINWQAVEDYDRQKIRHQFLKEQEEELRESLTDLQAAIEHIDEKSKERFQEAFTQVNSRFEKVFPIIFGGGSARLKIIGSLDSPDCGIDIIAQPPGKKMQNINLMSGGEKALTAVSLIFSIFLVKPSPFCLLDEVDAPLDDANVGRFNDLLKEMSKETQFILITHNKKTMELNDKLYGVTMQEPGISNAVSVQVQ